jgi:hypothetical protein
MSTVCISADANRIIKDALRAGGHALIEIKAASPVYNAVSKHCDIYLCRIGEELVVAPGQLLLIEEELRRNKVVFDCGENDPGASYPENIRYNAAQIGRLLIHNTHYSDPLVLSKAEAAGLLPVSVKQGYTKCSLVVVDDHSAITSDKAISSVLKKHGVDVLDITHGSVRLAGFPYGFLGGASGRVGDKIFFNGDLSAHPDYEKITAFIQKKGLDPVWYTEYPLTDIGSIIQL